MTPTTDMACKPRWATPKTRGRTLAPQVAKVARQLGLPLLPWQRQVLSVALERRGRHAAYRDCLVSVPRQSGKSSLALALIIWRLLEREDQLVLYSAQNRVAARRKLLHTWWPRLTRSELADRFTLFRGFGNECLSADNGSRLELLSATESAGHGETTDLVIIDEAWVHADATVEQSVRPTMATRADAQLWAMSTAGTAKSVWWRQKLEAGRAAAEMGLTDDLCLLEWAAHPDDDPTDEATWRAAMPALGHLIAPATVRRDLASMGIKEFRRAFLNLWEDEADSGWAVISKDASRLSWFMLRRRPRHAAPRGFLLWWARPANLADIGRRG
jgi:phage terminase large subunit-like protein